MLMDNNKATSYTGYLAIRAYFSLRLQLQFYTQTSVLIIFWCITKHRKLCPRPNPSVTA